MTRGRINSRFVAKMCNYVLLACLTSGTFLIPRTVLAAPAASYKSACKTDGDLSVMGFAYSKGWLLCETADYYIGGEQLYREVRIGSGVFKLIRGAGGAYRAEDLTQLAGVPPSIAAFLVRTLPHSCPTCRVPEYPPAHRS